MALLTQKEYARRRKVTPQYVSKLVNQRKIVLVNGKVDPKQADAARKAFARTGRVLKTKPVAKSPGRPVRQSDTQTAISNRARREGFEADLAELKLKLQSGVLLPRDQVLQAEAKKNSNIRNRFRRLPRTLAPILEPDNPARAESILQDAIDNILRELARDPLGMQEEAVARDEQIPAVPVAVVEVVQSIAGMEAGQ